MIKVIVSRDAEQMDLTQPSFYHLHAFSDGVQWLGQLSGPGVDVAQVVAALRAGGVVVIDLTDVPEEEEPDVV